MSAPDILIIEDDIHNRRLLGFQLDEQPWSIRQARNGRKALELCRESPPSAILLDLQMPSMDGFDFLQALRSEPSWRDIAVVVLTALDLTTRQHHQLKESGVRRVFSKGHYSADELLAEVRALLETPCPQS